MNDALTQIGGDVMQVGNPEYPLQQQTPTECIAKGFCGCDICPFYKWCDKPKKLKGESYRQVTGKLKAVRHEEIRL